MPAAAPADATWRTGAPRRIVVGVDGGAQSGPAYERARREARTRGAVVEVVTVCDAAKPSGSEPLLFPERQARRSAVAVQRALAEDSRCPVDEVDLSWVVVDGDAAQLLVEASAGALVLVLGSDGPPSPDGVRVRCRELARCSVLVV